MTAYGRRLVDQFDSASETCSTLSDLADLIAAAAHEMGFAHFALLHHVSLFAPSAGVVRLDTYPEDWTAELVSSHLGSIDPVHHACTRTNLGFAWERLGELTPIGPHEREMLVRARRFGLADGFTVPINIPGEPTGSCTFVVRAGKDLPRARLLGAEQIGAHAFDVARRLVGLAGPTRGARLTPRERECVKLLVAGCTDRQIAAELRISAETVHQHVKHARAVYGVTNRAQLVAMALRDGLVTFKDISPPDGGID